MHTLLSNLPASGNPGPQVGLIVSERLINMPVQTQPPMWRMLGEELRAAAGEVRRTSSSLSACLRKSLWLHSLQSSDFGYGYLDWGLLLRTLLLSLSLTPTLPSTFSRASPTRSRTSSSSVNSTCLQLSLALRRRQRRRRRRRKSRTTTWMWTWSFRMVSFLSTRRTRCWPGCVPFRS